MKLPETEWRHKHWHNQSAEEAIGSQRTGNLDWLSDPWSMSDGPCMLVKLSISMIFKSISSPWCYRRFWTLFTKGNGRCCTNKHTFDTYAADSFKSHAGLIAGIKFLSKVCFSTYATCEFKRRLRKKKRSSQVHHAAGEAVPSPPFLVHIQLGFFFFYFWKMNGFFFSRSKIISKGAKWKQHQQRKRNMLIFLRMRPSIWTRMAQNPKDFRQNLWCEDITPSQKRTWFSPKENWKNAQFRRVNIIQQGPYQKFHKSANITHSKRCLFPGRLEPTTMPLSSTLHSRKNRGVHLAFNGKKTQNLKIGLFEFFWFEHFGKACFSFLLLITSGNFLVDFFWQKGIKAFGCCFPGFFSPQRIRNWIFWSGDLTCERAAALLLPTTCTELEKIKFVLSDHGFGGTLKRRFWQRSRDSKNNWRAFWTFGAENWMKKCCCTLCPACSLSANTWAEDRHFWTWKKKKELKKKKKKKNGRK